ncbi:hypothetical protein HanIR_Chr16g0822181 [Helianthus annuus]|nr:hypothetical protein HanIR_Chr16g0822181 [Helianthus annuus]
MGNYIKKKKKNSSQIPKPRNQNLNLRLEEKMSRDSHIHYHITEVIIGVIYPIIPRSHVLANFKLRFW